MTALFMFLYMFSTCYATQPNSTKMFILYASPVSFSAPLVPWKYTDIISFNKVGWGGGEERGEGKVVLSWSAVGDASAHQFLLFFWEQGFIGALPDTQRPVMRPRNLKTTKQ